MNEIVVPGRFNGPPKSGNGGYSCGILAAHLPGTCKVRLRSPPPLLGELSAQLRSPVPGNKPLVVYSWPLGGEGRKLYGGVAIANAEGEVLACSHSTWIVLKA